MSKGKVYRYPHTQRREDLINILQEFFLTKTFTKTMDKALVLAIKHVKSLDTERKRLNERQKAIKEDLDLL